MIAFSLVAITNLLIVLLMRSFVDWSLWLSLAVTNVLLIWICWLTCAITIQEFRELQRHMEAHR